METLSSRQRSSSARRARSACSMAAPRIAAQCESQRRLVHRCHFQHDLRSAPWIAWLAPVVVALHARGGAHHGVVLGTAFLQQGR